MAGNTKTFVVTNLAAVDVSAVIDTMAVTIKENYDSASAPPTTDYDVMKPDSSATKVRQMIGTSYTFRKSTGYRAGEKVGAVQLPVSVSASTTFQQDDN